MKKIIWCSLLASYMLTGFGQITIPSSHMPRVGDTFIYNVDSSLYMPKPLTNGLYDFSDLKKTDTTVFYYKSNNNSALYPQSNIRMVIDTNEIGSIYFKSTTNDLSVIGLSDLTSQIPFPISSNLKGSLKYLTLPMTNSTNITTYDSIKFTIPASFIPPNINIDSILKVFLPSIPSGATVILDSATIVANLKLNLYVDGQGKIKTPVDSNIDALKVVRKISVTPKIIAHVRVSFGTFSLPFNYDVSSLLLGQLPFALGDIVQHMYISPSLRQDIVNATVDSFGRYQMVNYRYRTKNAPASATINAIGNGGEISYSWIGNNLLIDGLKPNKIYWLHIDDIQGRAIVDKAIISRDNQVDLGEQKGLYFIHIIDGQQHYLWKILNW